MGQRSEISILATADSSLAKYAELDTELARAISKRLKTYTYKFRDQNLENISKGLKNGSIALVNVRFTLIYLIMSLPQYGSDPSEEPLIEMLHISEDDGGLEPYFVFINAENDEWIFKSLNKMWVNLNTVLFL